MQSRQNVLAYLGIFSRNLLSPIVLFISLLSGFLFVFGEHTDAILLLSTVTLNSVVGIIQEIRARRALAKLEILTTQYARVVTAHHTVQTEVDKLLVGSHIEIRLGDQIPADGTVISAMDCQVDESLLTGESLPVDKRESDTVYAGSAVVAGTAIVRITAVGQTTRVNEMTKKLRWFDNRLTPIQAMISTIIRWLTIVTIMVSVIIYVDVIRSNGTVIDMVRTIVAGAIPLVPEGLLLATTLLFTYGAIKMVRSGVLIKKSAAIEGFGRLQILCLDKTGTLTEAQPALHQLVPLGKHRLEDLEIALSGLVAGEANPSATIRAISPQLPRVQISVIDTVAFSSARKWSAVRMEYKGKRQSVSLGAPEVLGKLHPFPTQVNQQISTYTKQGLRVLIVLHHTSSKRDLEQQVLGGGEVIGLVVLTNQLRPNIIDTIFYLQAHNVNLKIISGDSPETVRFIARKVGVRHYDAVISGDELAELSDAQWNHKVKEATIFARVLPEQKERLIKTFRGMGYTGMVGDGVNDTLALKEADLGVAMFEGSEAARQVADVVLLNNNFSAFPIGMRLGSQIIIGLEMVSCLFFNRIIAGFTILLLSIALNTSYPYLPRHVLLINIFVVAIPSLLWSLVPPESVSRRNPADFFRRTLRFAIPNGLVTGLAVIVTFVVIQLQSDVETARTATVLVATFLGLLCFRLIPLAMDAIDSQTARSWQIFYVSFSIVTMIFLATQSWFTGFFYLSNLGITQLLSCILIITLAGWAQVTMSTTKRRLFKLPRRLRAASY